MQHCDGRAGSVPARRGFSQRRARAARPLAALGLCLLLLAPAAAFAAQGASGELCVRDAGGALVGAWPLGEGEGFAIRYTHSVALTPVEDHFIIRDGVINLDKTVYQDFGAGLPSAPEPGQQMSAGNGRIVMSGYARPLKTFDVRVGRVAGHALLLPASAGGGEVPFTRLAPSGSALTFTYAPQGCGAWAQPQEPLQRQP
ncbi:MAG: DUF1850 domain-containing protein [Desulfovibrio sp.]|uniref:DUF1850 domain-containing protein n=1 Tax=Desulfovibrio sp. TaxID=885 RepID=UPI001A7867C9|nr:DUF1850 domain-containing protein [Desulfovibrio sp.]MBD5417553.1 DUF1850 domain-containing protein [Desulfovibrio sp.]